MRREMPEMPLDLCHNNQSAGRFVYNMSTLHLRNNSTECTPRLSSGHMEGDGLT